jgi:hypothetical protein
MAIFRPGFQKESSKENTLDSKADQALPSSLSKEGLLITGILKRMSDRHALLTEDLSKRIIRTKILRNIQKELINEWSPQAISSGSLSPQDDLVSITLDTIKKVNLYNNTFEKEDLRFMLRIGWKLAQFNLGLTQELEADEEYLAEKADLVKQMDSISNAEINNLLTAYLNFSFALNSGYLLSSYLSSNPKMKKALYENLSPDRIKELRDEGLNSLLSYGQMIMKGVLKSVE